MTNEEKILICDECQEWQRWDCNNFGSCGFVRNGLVSQCAVYQSLVVNDEQETLS